MSINLSYTYSNNAFHEDPDLVNNCEGRPDYRHRNFLYFSKELHFHPRMWSPELSEVPWNKAACYLNSQIPTLSSTINTIIWLTLFTWLWSWLPLRWSKRQSPATVFLKTTFTRTITQDKHLILLGSNLLPISSTLAKLRAPELKTFFLQNLICFSPINDSINWSKKMEITTSLLFLLGIGK